MESLSRILGLVLLLLIPGYVSLQSKQPGRAINMNIHHGGFSFIHIKDGCSNEKYYQVYFSLVGMFELPVEEGDAENIREDLDSSQVFLKALDYMKWDRHLSYNITVEGFLYDTSNHNGFLLYQYICESLANLHVAASLGVWSSSLREFMRVVSTRKYIPYLELMPSSDYSREMVLHMHPAPGELVQLIQEFITQKEWENVFIVYESQNALKTYLNLLTLHKTKNMRVKARQLTDLKDFSDTFNQISQLEVFHIIVDCQLKIIPRFLNKALEMQMLTNKYHYHFTSMDLHTLDLAHFSYGGANITWSQLVNKTGATRDKKNLGVYEFETFLKVKGMIDPPAHYFTTYNALIVDGLIVLTKALSKVVKEIPAFTTQSVYCESDMSIWQHGFALRNFMKAETVRDGLTGNIQFDMQSGQRINYTLSIMELMRGGEIRDIGTYNQARGVTLKPYPTPDPEPISEDDYMNRVLKVVTLIEPPFMSNKSNHAGDQLSGNDRFEGFIVDLMEHIAKHLGIRYEFYLVADKEYGSRMEDGTFNGLVHDVMTKKADMAAASLTINYDREQVIDFTKPFMTFGIAILYKTPQKEPPHLLSFMEPIKIRVWGTMIASVVIVSFCMYFFSRFSPTEWENPFPCNENYEYMENQFNLANAFWFSVGSIMQQGCDIMPKAPSTRIIAIAWWLFTLIIISSYTANLAAFLTITTLSETFKNADELAQQTKTPYGCKHPGNTCSFFEKSDIPVYKEMWRYMSNTPGAFSNTLQEGINRVKNEDYAFLMESSGLQYQTVTDENCELTQVGPPLNSLSYGIGVRTKSPLRDLLSNIILKLNENQVLLELYNKWWKVNDNKCGGESGESNEEIKLMLENLGGIFVFLMAGLGIASIVLCIEIIAFAIHRSREEKQPIHKIMRIWLKNSIQGSFPNSVSIDSLDRNSIRSGLMQHFNNNSNHVKNSIIEEGEEPLNNGHTDCVPHSRTTETLT